MLLLTDKFPSNEDRINCFPYLIGICVVIDDYTFSLINTVVDLVFLAEVMNGFSKCLALKFVL